MKISQIRDVLRFAEYCRCDYAGHTRAEYVKADVAGKLNARIAEMEALVIAPRFAADIAFRDAEIRRCRQEIINWEAAKAQPQIDNRNCQQGGKRHVFLGSHRCTLCGRPNLQLV